MLASDSDSKTKHLSGVSMASYSGSVISYVLTQETVPRSRDIDPEGYCRVSSEVDDSCRLSEPRLAVRRFPSPLRVKSESRSKFKLTGQAFAIVCIYSHYGYANII